jgi:hypothetical protein
MMAIRESGMAGEIVTFVLVHPFTGCTKMCVGDQVNLLREGRVKELAAALQRELDERSKAAQQVKKAKETTRPAEGRKEDEDDEEEPRVAHLKKVFNVCWSWVKVTSKIDFEQFDWAGIVRSMKPTIPDPDNGF